MFDYRRYFTFLPSIILRKRDMHFFEEKIRKEGEVRQGNILKVDGFFNHQVDVMLLEKVACEFFGEFQNAGVTKVLTIEVSGIPLATLIAEKLNVPMVFARKVLGSNASTDNYTANVYSYTKQVNYGISVPKRFICENDTVLLVDDFLANGEALRGLMSIVSEAKAKLAGCCIGIEKSFQGGGDELRSQGIKIVSAAKISAMSENNIEFRD